MTIPAPGYSGQPHGGADTLTRTDDRIEQAPILTENTHDDGEYVIVIGDHTIPVIQHGIAPESTAVSVIYQWRGQKDGPVPELPRKHWDWVVLRAGEVMAQGYTHFGWPSLPAGDKLSVRVMAVMAGEPLR